jgi:CBS domain-containing protein
MAERYPIRDYHRRYQDEEGDNPNRERGERYRSERGYGYGPVYDVEFRQPPVQYFDRDREGRGFIERAGDEVRSWFGDEEAELRRRLDERSYGQRDRERRSRRARYHLDDVRAGDIMTRGVVTVYPWETVERAARLMGGCDCGILPVVNNNGHLIGMVTDRDIALRIIARGIDPRHTRVGECMSEDLYTCHEYDSIESCMRRMARHQIRRLPIVDDYDRVIGIISQGDMAWFASMHPGHGNRRAVADLVCAVSEPQRAQSR